MDYIKIHMRGLLGRLALRWHRRRHHKKILAANLKAHTVIHEGLHFFYYANNHAERPPLILLHGFLDSSLTFRNMVADLSPRYNLFLIDLPGFGRSHMPAIRELWHINHIARALARFIYMHLGLRDPIFLTHSLGGLVAVHIYFYLKANYPDLKVGSMHMMAAGLLKLPRGERDRLRRRFFPNSTEEIEMLLRNLYNEDIPSLPPMVLQGLLDLWSIQGYYYLAENTIEREDEIFFQPAQIAKMKTDMYLYWGDADRVTSPAMAQRIKRAVKGSRLYMVKGAGHALHLEKGHEVFEMIQKSLNKKATLKT